MWRAHFADGAPQPSEGDGACQCYSYINGPCLPAWFDCPQNTLGSMIVYVRWPNREQASSVYVYTREVDAIDSEYSVKMLR
jgi:hypothetical protein